MLDRAARLASTGFAALVLTLAAAGCSGSTASPSTAGGGGGAASPSASATGSAPASASTGTGASASTGAAAGADACALVPAEEVGTALGVSGVKATPMPGSDVSYCNYDSADGKSVAATSYSTNASAVYPTFASAEGAIPIPGVADGAVISGGVVYVLKGNSMFGFQPGSGANITPDKLAAIAKTIASSAAGRM